MSCHRKVVPYHHLVEETQTTAQCNKLLGFHHIVVCFFYTFSSISLENGVGRTLTKISTLYTVRVTILFLVYNLYFFYMLLQPCYGVVVVYPLLPLDGNILHLRFFIFFFGGNFALKMESRLLNTAKIFFFFRAWRSCSVLDWRSFR